MRRVKGIFIGALLLCFALIGTACVEDAAQDTLEPAGPYAREADKLWDLTFGIAVAVFVIVEGLLIYALIRFRHRPGREPKQFHGNPKVEIVLTVLPALLLAGVAIPTIDTLFDISGRPEGDVLDVTVVAHQFWWEYEYPEEDIVTANELHIPTDRPVYISLRGALQEPVEGDAEVIHSFWVPRLGGTQDIVPGRVNYLTIQADDPGTYLGQCKEFCGLGHPDMRLRVIAHTPEDFDEWIADQQEPAATELSGDAAEGESLFAEGAEGGQFANGPVCSACHAIDPSTEAQPRVGPNLAHFASRTTFAGAVFDNNTQNLTNWLENPPRMKPGAKMPDLGLTPDHIRALVAYLESLE